MGITMNYRILSIILILAVLVLASHIGLTSYSGYVIGVQSDSYVAGYNDGVSSAVSQIVAQTGSCNPLPVRFGNVTRTLIDVACLQSPSE